MNRKFKVTANKAIQITASSRSQLIDEIDKMYGTAFKIGESVVEKVEKILEKHNASEDDSDPNEGFFVTMSDEDLVKTIEELKPLFNISDRVIEKFWNRVDSSVIYDVWQELKSEGYPIDYSDVEQIIKDQIKSDN